MDSYSDGSPFPADIAGETLVQRQCRLAFFAPSWAESDWILAAARNLFGDVVGDVYRVAQYV